MLTSLSIDPPNRRQRAHFGRLVGRQPEVVVRETPGTLRGSIADVSRRRSFTGPCQVGWKEGMRRMVEARVATS